MTAPGARDQHEFDPEQVVVRDKRRIDPETGQLRDPGTAGAAPGLDTAPASGPEPLAQAADLEQQLLERTEDLRRVTAEYANYRKRVDRDRAAQAEAVLGNVLMSLLPVLDDIGRARAHEELTGGFAAVATALEITLAKLGLTPVGESGEPFDPVVHEAVTSSPSEEVTVATAAEVYRAGYRVGERLLRPAQVAVAEPA